MFNFLPSKNKCLHIDTVVIDSRFAPTGIRRRRKCINCEFRFTTIETLVENTKNGISISKSYERKVRKQQARILISALENLLDRKTL